MIEINLLPGKKKKATPGGAGFKLALPDFRGLLASIKNPWLLVASATSLVVVGGGLLWFITQSTRLRVAQNRLTEVQAEKRRFDAVIAQKRQSERIRDSLVAEINVIRGIDADRYIWPHVLDQITKALPPYTWLTGISAAGGGNTAPVAPVALPPGADSPDATGPGDRARAGRDQGRGGRHRAGQVGSRGRHGGGPAPQGGGVHGAARRDAAPGSREERSPGADRRHLDQGQGTRRDHRPNRAPGRRGGTAVRHVPLPPRDHRALRPAGGVPVRHREPAAHHRPAGRGAQGGRGPGAEAARRYAGRAARGAIRNPHLREGSGAAPIAGQEGRGRGGRTVSARFAAWVVAVLATGPLAPFPRTGLAAQAKRAPAPAPAAPAKPDSAKRDSVTTPVLVREVFSYEGGGRDPFLSLLRSGDIRPLLSDLRVVGIYYDGRYPARSVAVLRDVTNSKVYRVKPGNIIGRLKATTIRPREIVFTVQEFGFERQESLQLAKQEVTP